MIKHIPHYFLYGEANQDVDQHFLHLESIADRSQLHEWKIQPHVHRELHHLLLVMRGGGVFEIDGQEIRFGAPALISVPMRSVHGFVFQPSTDGKVITASSVLLKRIGVAHPELATIFDEAGVLKLTSADAEMLLATCDSLQTEFRGCEIGRRAAIESYLLEILVRAIRVKADACTPTISAHDPDAMLVARYRSLIELNFRTRMSAVEYAEKLCVSQERLRVACVRLTSSSPLALLNSRRLLEAKRNLLYTSMSVAVLAEACGFEDPAYFSRFFASRTGKSPRVYRSTRGAATPGQSLEREFLQSVEDGMRH